VGHIPGQEGLCIDWGEGVDLVRVMVGNAHDGVLYGVYEGGEK
jgi:hypothetical protein